MSFGKLRDDVMMNDHLEPCFVSFLYFNMFISWEIFFFFFFFFFLIAFVEMCF